MTKKLLLPLLALCLAAGLCGCSPPSGAGGMDASPSAAASPEPEPEYPVSVNGRAVSARPGRIVSLSPSLTDKLVDLGHWDRLSGISNFCLGSGEEDDPLPRCGIAQSPDLNAIYGLDAHLLLSENELSEFDMEALEQMGVEVVILPRAGSVDELMQIYMDLSMLLDGKSTGKLLGKRFVTGFEERLSELSDTYTARAHALDAPKRALYLRLLDFTVATGDTLESELMGLVGLENIARDQTGWLYPDDDANSEAGLAAFRSTDVIYCDERYVTIRMLEQSAYYKSLQAVLKDWYLYIDCTPFERQTLAMLDVLENMAEYAYPGGESEAPA